MEKVIVVGSLNMDQVTKVDFTPKVGQTIMGQGLAMIPGGKGANQAVALGKLGADICIVGAVGDDANGEKLSKNLKKMNVDSKYLKIVDDVPTGIAIIMVNKSGDNSIVVIAGANDELYCEDIKEDMFEDKGYLVCQLETPIDTVEYALKIARSKGVKTILNPAPAAPLSDELLGNVDILIPNETEFEILTGVEIKNKQDFLEGYAVLNDKGVKKIIVTLGEKGCWYYDGKDFIEVEAEKVMAVDTTSAGDSFIGGLVTKLASGACMEQAMKFGVKVAGITVTRFGAQSSIPSIVELN